MEFTRSEWLLAMEIAESYDRELRLVGPDNKSPTFQYGQWTGAVEHTRKFRSVVLRYPGSAQISLPQNWVVCPDSDVQKGWAFRVNNCEPVRVKELLEQLRAAESA